MRDKAGGCWGGQLSGFALFSFHIGGGGLTFSCNEDGSHALFGVPGQDQGAATRPPTWPPFVQASLGPEESRLADTSAPPG